MAKRRSRATTPAPTSFHWLGSAARLTLSGLPWAGTGKISAKTTPAQPLPKLYSKIFERVSGLRRDCFAGIAELIDLIAARSVGDTGDMRVLLDGNRSRQAEPRSGRPRPTP